MQLIVLSSGYRRWLPIHFIGFAAPFALAPCLRQRLRGSASWLITVTHASVETCCWRSWLPA